MSVQVVEGERGARKEHEGDGKIGDHIDWDAVNPLLLNYLLSRVRQQGKGPDVVFGQLCEQRRCKYLGFYREAKTSFVKPWSLVFNQVIFWCFDFVSLR